MYYKTNQSFNYKFKVRNNLQRIQEKHKIHFSAKYNNIFKINLCTFRCPKFQ